MKKNIPASQSGFTLLELLLVVGVAAVLMLGAAQMVRSWATTQSAKGAGTQLQNITSMVNEFVVANWSTLSQTDNIMNDASWVDLQTTLINGGMVDPNTSQILSPIGTPLQIAFQIDTADPTNRIFRTIIFSTRPLPNGKVTAAARQGGAYAGTWTSFPDTANIYGAYGQWAENPNILLGAPINLPTPPTQEEGYLVSVFEIEETQAIGPYLYRDVIPNAPDANSMGTSLDMDGNDITGLNSLETETLSVLDTANFNNMNVTGNTQFPNGITVDGMLVSNGSMSVSGDMNLASPLTVAGTVNTGALNVATLQANQVEAASIDTPSLTINNGNLTVDGNVDLGTGTLTTGTMSATDCVVISGSQYVVAGNEAACPP
jgi:prepilin-type N-terminal cleavage/methylation domain-containing protein